MDIKKFFEKARDKKKINPKDLLELTKRFTCRKLVVAFYLVGEGLITVEEAVESTEKEDNFFILANA